MSIAFQRYVTCHLHASKSKWFPTFNGQESNWQFDSRPSFGHNLCFKYPNGSCEPIWNIYIPKSFQWCIYIFNLMNFVLYNLLLKISRIHWDSNSQSGNSLKSVGVHSLTFSYTPKTMKCDSQASLLACTFASSCFGREPKARVATHHLFVDLLHTHTQHTSQTWKLKHELLEIYMFINLLLLEA